MSGALSLEGNGVAQRSRGQGIGSARDFEAAFALESFQSSERRSPWALSQEIFVVTELPQTALYVREAHLFGLASLKHAFLPIRQVLVPLFGFELVGFSYPIRKYSMHVKEE